METRRRRYREPREYREPEKTGPAGGAPENEYMPEEAAPEAYAPETPVRGRYFASARVPEAPGREAEIPPEYPEDGEAGEYDETG